MRALCEWIDALDGCPGSQIGVGVPKCRQQRTKLDSEHRASSKNKRPINLARSLHESLPISLAH